MPTSHNINVDIIKKIVSVLDLTCLQDKDTEASIALFCKKARTPFGEVAAVCIYPRFVGLVAAELANTSIKTATVINFPSGDALLELVLKDIQLALAQGAQEIDLVFPYQRYLAGDKDYVQEFILACKAMCGDQILLKVILETGMLQDLPTIAEAGKIVLTAGADFVKTSTGKIPQGATLEAVSTLLEVIRYLSPHLKRTVGIKISGGIRTVQQAAQYLQLAETKMGAEWVTPASFRIGASQLIDEICAWA